MYQLLKSKCGLDFFYSKGVRMVFLQLDNKKATKNQL